MKERTGYHRPQTADGRPPTADRDILQRTAAKRCRATSTWPQLRRMQDFKRLRVWQKAHECFLNVQSAFQPLRAQRVSGLRGQAIRAAASITSNIAEGCGKATTREFLRFLDIASGSSRELENHLIVARDLEVISQPQFDGIDEQVTDIRKMLAGLSGALRCQAPRTE